MVNTNKQMLDLPFFELLNQPPTASSGLSCIATAEDGSDRFVYYLSGSLFYRYDTVADTFQQLASLPTPPVSAVSMRYTRRRGFHGPVLGATSTSVRLPSVRGALLNGATIHILQGSGRGQERVLTYTGETVHDAGMATGAAATYIQDTTKNWRVNQWHGYTLAVTFGADATQYKKILYNSANALYVSDVNLQPHDPWNNQPFLAAAPYAVPAAGSHFQIMSSDFTVPAWNTVPDSTSFFTTLTGGIYVVSGAAAAPFMTLQYYDVLHDSWQTKTCNQGLLGASFGTGDLQIEPTGKVGAALATSSGTVSALGRGVTDSAGAYAVDRWRNHRLVITGGTGAGQSRRIVSNTATTFTVSRGWDTLPGETITFEVWPDYDQVYAVGGGTGAMLAYSPENDLWLGGQHFDDGVVATISCKFADWVPLGVTSGTRIAAGVVAVNPVPTAGGSGYKVGDVLTCAVGGAGAQVVVTALSAAGVVGSVALVNSGTTTGYTVGTGKATSGAGGTGCTIEITAVGATANVTLASAAWFNSGDVVTFAGCTEAAWNTAHTILGVSAVSAASCTFSAATAATANMLPALTQNATTISDASKNWVVNEHVGRIVHLSVAGLAPTAQVRWISANTANTLTVAGITTATNGTSKYQIYDAKIFGCDDQRRETGGERDGHASGGSTTTLVDASKNWVPGQWANYSFKIEAGTGYGSGRIVIVANTANTLTYAAQAFVPDATTRYEIADSWGLASAGAASSLTDASKNYAVNQWSGKRFKFTAGTLAGTETTTTANTANTFTTASTATPDATTAYAIVAVPAHGAGVGLRWTWGASDANKKKLIYRFRGGASAALDIYDIASERWKFAYFYQGQDELFTTGSSYAYDGANTIFASRSAAAAPVRVMGYNIDTNKLQGQATSTWLQGTVTIGNFLEVVASPVDAYKYLYVMQTTGTLFSRANIF